jgi:hypothetical protein
MSSSIDAFALHLVSQTRFSRFPGSGLISSVSLAARVLLFYSDFSRAPPMLPLPIKASFIGFLMLEEKGIE